jgi:tetratricopeptide (TPR) repeat protein
MAWAYQGRGTVWMHKGEMLKAIPDFTTALKYDPQLAWAFFNRGLAQVYLGNESEGQKDFAECLKLRPDLKTDLEPRIELARELRTRAGSKQP